MKLEICLVLTLLVLQIQCHRDNFYEELQGVAKRINADSNSTWKANEDLQTWRNIDREELKKLNGAYLTEESSLPLVSTVASSIPDSFDSREQWSNCESIQEIRDQSNCGSCWAVSAAEVFSDRWCVAFGQKDQTKMSALQLLTCCDFCGNGCAGGWNDMAWNYFMQFGSVSGNLYGQDQYCQSYFLPPCDHHVSGPLGPCPASVKQPECTYECSSNFQGTFGNDRHYASGYGYTKNNVKAMQTEIMTNGPIQGAFTVYEDFYTYKSGVYQHTTGEFHGGHAIKILGWGVENDVPYWLCANSWNTSWGDKGYFKILRGSNECGIENVASFGYVVPNQ